MMAVAGTYVIAVVVRASDGVAAAPRTRSLSSARYPVDSTR
jgi:hypothetical protein